MPILAPDENEFATPPTSPEEPPSAHNVVSAIRYETQINQALLRDTERIMPEDTIVEAAQYRASILAAHAPDAGPVPHWFGPAMQEALAPVLRELRDTKVTLLKNINYQLGNGSIRNFTMVPFSVMVNGQMTLQDPTAPPHNLPPLLTSSDIRNLTNPQSAQYYRGYHPQQTGPLPSPEVRRKRIAVAIGGTPLH